jgi:hypothetical protein
MSVWGDMDYEMQPLPLDWETAERLMSGRVAPEDAPPGYGPVVRLLDAASAEASAEELANEREGVVAFALAVGSSRPTDSVSPRGFSMPFSFSRARLVAAALATALAATAGLASAGSLPGAAQDVASEVLAKLGVSVPGPNDSAGTHPDVRGSSATAPSAERKGQEISELARTTEATGVEKGAAVSTAASDGKSRAGQAAAGSNSRAQGNPAAAGTGTAGKGSEISELARSTEATEATGVEKGAAVSTAASEGKSQAGEQGSAAGAGSANSPPSGSNGGGTGTADTASGGKSSEGTTTANAASNGSSSAGSGNASSGKSRRP